MRASFHLFLLGCLLSLSAPLMAAREKPLSLEVDGNQRFYLLHDFSRAAPAPLVIVLHGGGGSGENAMEQTGFDKVARREGLVVAYPYGSSRLFERRLLTWNAGHCCSYAREARIDDVGFISRLIDTLVAQGKVDPQRVYVTGLSNGGMLTQRLGMALPDRITAIAPVISSLFGDEPTGALDMPVLMINGADDGIIKPEGGELQLRAALGGSAADLPVLPVSEQVAYWVARNACTQAQQTQTADYVHLVYSACRSSATVEHYLVANNGHAWPGGTAPRRQADKPSPKFSASEVIWEFFSRYPKRTIVP